MPADEESAETDRREKSGTFLVTQVDEASAVLRDVETAEVHTLTAPGDLVERAVLQADLAAVPPMEVTWELEAVQRRWTPPLERSPEPPTRQAQELAAEQSVGEVTRTERAGEGEVHVLTVPEADTEAAATEVLEDEETLARAARLGVERVEVRAADGVLSVRYLP